MAARKTAKAAKAAPVEEPEELADAEDEEVDDEEVEDDEDEDLEVEDEIDPDFEGTEEDPLLAEEPDVVAEGDIPLDEAVVPLSVVQEAEEVEDEEDDVLQRVVADDDDDDVDIDGLREGEFICTNCFLAKSPSQLADAKRMICRDCV